MTRHYGFGHLAGVLSFLCDAAVWLDDLLVAHGFTRLQPSTRGST